MVVLSGHRERMIELFVPSLDLTKILHVAATVAMVMGSELHEKAVLPKDHFILDSITNAAVSWLPW